MVYTMPPFLSIAPTEKKSTYEKNIVKSLGGCDREERGEHNGTQKNRGIQPSRKKRTARDEGKWLDECALFLHLEDRRNKIK